MQAGNRCGATGLKKCHSICWNCGYNRKASGRVTLNRAPSRGQRKNIKIFKEWVAAEAAAHSLCGCGQTVLFHGRQDAKIALDSAGVVVMNIAVDHLNKLVFAGKSLAVVALTLQDSPKSFHGTVVNAVGYPGHALGHPGPLQPGMEGAVGVLEASVTVEQGMGIRVGLHRLVKGLEYQRIIITVSDHISHDPPVIQVQNGAEVDLVDCNALIPLELSHIAQPLLVGLVCMKLPVQDILRSKLGILSRSGTAMVAVLDGRFDVPLAFDTSHLFFYAYL